MKQRLDDLIFSRGLAESKNQAQAIIMEGKVSTRGGARLDKPGKKYDDDIEIFVEAPPRFVGRAGEKLEGFLQKYPEIEVAGKLGLDVGACTGGFTDCLLQRGAREVVAIDVGRAQLHNKLARDPRVISIEQINARSMVSTDLPYPLYDIIVMDISFISQKKVIGNVWNFLAQGGVFVSLIKPQFEITKAEADHCQGVIKDPALRERVIAEIREAAAELLPGMTEIGFAPSTIAGTEGNQEYLICWRKS
jgi:23S rRNA (cytidine1920-2'-O)/16S rRNA (cytidine1409-2'-O)-methyltransferase